jgi:radical SAM superfamily enzyme YgiQ (UPF0313 family)
MVYRRRWAGLPPERVVAEVAALRSRYGVTDVGFQDEIFFVDGRRTLAIAEGLLASGVAVTWTAAARVEEVTRLTDAERALLRRSGLRKLVIGAESGEPEVLARIHKGIEASQILEAATALHRAEIAGHFNFIVGFPFDETPTEVETTLRTVREVMRFPRHAFALFYYAPYPGSPIFEEMARARRAELPATLDGWAAFDYVRRPGSWVSPATHRAVEDFKFYGRAARLTGVLRPLGLVARTRHARGLYAMPVERWVGNFVRRRVLGHADI